MSDRPNQRQPQRLGPRPRVFTPANQFDYDHSKQPPDMQYEYKTLTVGGMETNDRVIAEQNGWRAVPAERHPEMTGLRTQKGGEIVRGGQLLMELPKQWYQEGREEEEFKAKLAVESQIQRLGIEGRKQGGKRGGVTKTMAPIVGEVIE